MLVHETSESCFLAGSCHLVPILFTKASERLHSMSKVVDDLLSNQGYSSACSTHTHTHTQHPVRPSIGLGNNFQRAMGAVGSRLMRHLTLTALFVLHRAVPCCPSPAPGTCPQAVTTPLCPDQSACYQTGEATCWWVCSCRQHSRF